MPLFDPMELKMAGEEGSAGKPSEKIQMDSSLARGSSRFSGDPTSEPSPRKKRPMSLAAKIVLIAIPVLLACLVTGVSFMLYDPPPTFMLYDPPPTMDPLAAVLAGDLDQIKKNVERGADVNQHYQDLQDATPLHLATTRNRFSKNSPEELIEYLLEVGANPDLLNARHRTARYVAHEHGRPELIRLMPPRSSPIDADSLVGTWKGGGWTIKFEDQLTRVFAPNDTGVAVSAFRVNQIDNQIEFSIFTGLSTMSPIATLKEDGSLQYWPTIRSRTSIRLQRATASDD